jgi:hypothetical protein
MLFFQLRQATKYILFTYSDYISLIFIIFLVQEICPAHLIVMDLIILLNITWRVQVMFLTFSLLLLRPLSLAQYCPQQAVLKHCHSTFFLKYVRQNSAHIQNNVHNK